jgi:hypothetical protein
MLSPIRALLQGFPTASLHPEDCRSRLEYPCFDLAGNPAWDAAIPRLNQMPNGVYFGCGEGAAFRVCGLPTRRLLRDWLALQ